MEKGAEILPSNKVPLEIADLFPPAVRRMLIV